MRMNEYKILTTILRELEDGVEASNHMHLEPLLTAVENVIKVVYQRKQDLFTKGFSHEIHSPSADE